LRITISGLDANRNQATVDFTSGGSETGQVDPLPNGVDSPEFVHFSMFGLTVNASSVPAPIAGAGLPAVVAFSAGGNGGGGLLEQRHKPLGTPPGGPQSVLEVPH
jgi:hypothetical protein